MAGQILFFLIVGALVLWFASQNAKTPKRRGIYFGILITLFGLLLLTPDILARVLKREYSTVLGEEYGFVAVGSFVVGVIYIIYYATWK